MNTILTTVLLILVTTMASSKSLANVITNKTKFVSINASTRDTRTKLLNIGIDIEEVYSDRVWALVTEDEITRAKVNGFKILTEVPSEVFFRSNPVLFPKHSAGHSTGVNAHDKDPKFPSGDDRFHDYTEMKAALETIQKTYPNMSRLQSIGKSTEGRDLMAIHLNSTESDLDTGHSAKPGIVFMGAHHAREHLSSEVPLILAQFMLDHQREHNIGNLLTTRDIWIIPMVNPDGAEFDIEGGSYHMWRKNRRPNNREMNIGVDLNRNYGYLWGTGGSSTMESSDVYMGPAPFSEPETQAVRDFVNDHLNLKVLLSYHTYSELILYPWGYSYSPIDKKRDHDTFKTMANTMAKWNHYKAEQSSDLYITSGDTTDWAYGTLGIFAFTFELTPKGQLGGGFYPGAKVIDSTFNANLNPALYLMDLADNPYRAIDQGAGASIWYK